MSDQVPPLPASIPVQDTAADRRRAARLRLAFQTVFGQPGRNSRSSDQALVLKHLRKVSCMDKPCFEANEKSGLMDPVAAAHRDGARTIFLIIERQLELAKKDVEAEKPKPKVRR